MITLICTGTLVVRFRDKADFHYTLSYDIKTLSLMTQPHHTLALVQAVPGVLTGCFEHKILRPLTLPARSCPRIVFM